ARAPPHAPGPGPGGPCPRGPPGASVRAAGRHRPHVRRLRSRARDPPQPTTTSLRAMISRALLLLSALAASAICVAARAADRPNIVYVLADDLGYGDVRALNPEGKIATPNMDRLAADGMTFTDAHGSA